MDNDPFAWEIGRKNVNTFEVMVSHACHPSSCKPKLMFSEILVCIFSSSLCVKVTQKEEHLETHYPRNKQNEFGMLIY
jgi:hypothetical protein